MPRHASKSKKKAWKAVDISAEETALEQKREAEKVTGLKNTDLFQIDVAGEYQSKKHQLRLELAAKDEYRGPVSKRPPVAGSNPYAPLPQAVVTKKDTQLKVKRTRKVQKVETKQEKLAEVLAVRDERRKTAPPPTAEEVAMKAARDERRQKRAAAQIAEAEELAVKIATSATAGTGVLPDGFDAKAVAAAAAGAAAAAATATADAAKAAAAAELSKSQQKRARAKKQKAAAASAGALTVERLRDAPTSAAAAAAIDPRFAASGMDPAMDIWGVGAVIAQQHSLVAAQNKHGFREKRPAMRKPVHRTDLKEAMKLVVPGTLPVAVPGTSFNPSEEDHKQALAKAIEFDAKERAERERIARQLKGDVGVITPAPAYDWDKADADAAAERPLWVAKKNAAAQAKKLTKAERNKLDAKRVKERAKSAAEARIELEKQLARLPAIVSKLKKHDAAVAAARAEVEELKATNPCEPRLGKHKVTEQFPDVALSDEMPASRSLREAKVSTNIVMDQYKRFEQRHLIEPTLVNRRAGKRKYKIKEYERHKGWTAEYDELMKGTSQDPTVIAKQQKAAAAAAAAAGGQTKKRKTDTASASHVPIDLAALSGTADD